MNATVTRSELALDRSLVRPLIVTQYGRPRNVLLSYEEYQRLLSRDRRIVRLDDWAGEDLAALEMSPVTPGLEHLDAELDASFCVKVLEAIADPRAAVPHDEVKARFAGRRAAALAAISEPEL